MAVVDRHRGSCGSRQPAGHAIENQGHQTVRGNETSQNEFIRLRELQKTMSQPVIIHHSAEPYNRVITAHPMAIEGLKAMLHTTAPDLLLVMHLGQPVPVGTNCVMPLLYRHPQLVHAAPVSSELKDEPVVVPLMHFMFEVQEKDTLEIIVDFFFRKAAEFLKKKCPEFLARPKILVSTRDFRQECRFPNTKRAFCWDELIKDFTRKAIQTGLSPRTETFRNLVDSVRNFDAARDRQRLREEAGQPVRKESPLDVRARQADVGVLPEVDGQGHCRASWTVALEEHWIEKSSFRRHQQACRVVQPPACPGVRRLRRVNLCVSSKLREPLDFKGRKATATFSNLAVKCAFHSKFYHSAH